MSKYYNDGPFTIEQWNTLIQDVNDILQNPPAGTDCEPIDVIAEVTDPHLWATEDIEEVRDKLIETCPEISFDTELRLWKQEIIDEIETEMDKAWCDCENESTETNYGPYGPFPWEACAAAHISENCCGNLIQSNFGNFLCGEQYYHEDVYFSPWYPCPANDFDAIGDSYSAAKEATGNYINTVNELFALSKQVKNEQVEIDNLTQSIDALIEELEELCENDPNPNCGAALKTQICAKGQDARDHQNDLDDLQEDFDEEFPLMDQYFREANTAADTNWELVCELEPRFPPDKNIIGEYIAPDVGTIPWYKWFNPGCPYLNVCDSEGEPSGCVPEDDCEPGDVDARLVYYLRFQLGQRSDDDLWPMLYLCRWARCQPPSYPNGGWDWMRDKTRISPGGTPFVTGSVADAYLQLLTVVYTERQTRFFCNQHEGVDCIAPCDGGTFPRCTWSPWLQQSTWWFVLYDCVGMTFPWLDECDDKTGVQIAQEEAARSEPRNFKAILEHREGITTKDFTEHQDHYWEVHSNWYSYHPEYDDRHEAYC